MGTSILNDIKPMLDIPVEVNAFDKKIQTFINMAFSDLAIIGVGTSPIFSISGPETTWEEYAPYADMAGSITTFIYLKTKLLFDPPTSSYIVESFNRTIDQEIFNLQHYFDTNGGAL